MLEIGLKRVDSRSQLNGRTENIDFRFKNQRSIAFENFYWCSIQLKEVNRFRQFIFSFAVLLSVISAYNLSVNEGADGAAKYCTESICSACAYAQTDDSKLGQFCSAFMAQIGNDCCNEEGSGYQIFSGCKLSCADFAAFLQQLSSTAVLGLLEYSFISCIICLFSSNKRCELYPSGL